MRFVIIILVFVFCLLSSSFAFADTKTDSLLTVLKTTTNEKDKSLLLLNVAGTVSINDSVIYYTKQALNIADKISNDSIKLTCYRNLVRTYQQKPFAEDSALVYVPLIDKIIATTNFNLLAISSYSVITNLYLQLHEYDLAIKYSQLSLDAAKLTGEVSRICEAKNNLGDVYRKAGFLTEAMDIFKEAATDAEKEHNLSNAKSGYRGMAICYDIAKDYTNAAIYFQKALDIALQEGNDRVLNSAYGNVAVAYWHLKKYDEAIVNLNKAVTIAKKYNLKNIQTDYKNLADVYLDKGDIDSAIYFGKMTLELAEKNNERFLQNINHSILAKAYKQNGDYKMAYEHTKRAMEIGDSLKSKDKDKAIADAEATYNNKEKKAKIELLNKENEIQKLTLRENESAIYFAGIKATQTENEIELLNQNKDIQALKLLKSQQELANRELQTKANVAELELTKKEKVLQKKQLSEQALYRNLLIVGSLVLIVFGLLLFNRFRLSKQLENQKALTTQRKQISADLHDDIGATLSSISIYSEAMKNKYNQGDFANAMVLAEKIGVNSREMMDNMSDIVWAINPGHDSLQQLFDRMSSFAVSLLTEKNIKCQFDFENDLVNTSIPMEARKNMYLIFKEAINNIAKYANCQQVNVQLNRVDNLLTMKISDDGKGFNTSPPTPPERSGQVLQKRGELGGNGIENMKHRAAEINAQLEITSEINNGTTVFLKYPLVRG